MVERLRAWKERNYDCIVPRKVRLSRAGSPAAARAAASLLLPALLPACQPAAQLVGHLLPLI